ncbi:MAG TPA: hypothetical protein PLL53_21700 [Saprospiraceae bacterium]|nr:hypothetical protein [Saprospiraceae bacterium]
MKYSTIPFLLLVLFSACSSQSGSDAAANSKQAAPAPAFPTLPIETIRTLVAECDYIDIIMYQPQFSMSQNERSAVMATLSHISEVPAVHNAANPATGHIFYQAKGQTLLEADLYLRNEGSYLVFYQDGKPAFANAMTQQGVAFFANILSQLQGAPQQ